MCRNHSGRPQRRSIGKQVRSRTVRVEALETRCLLASFTILEDTPLTIDIPDGQTVTIAVPPKLGGVRRTDAGDLLYTSGENAHGSDSFVYRISDGQTEPRRETVSITVTPVNDPPRLYYPNLTYDVPQGVPYSSPAQGVLVHAASPDFEPLRASLVEGPTHGTLTLNADGSFVYQSAANYFGLDHFKFRASEGTETADSVTGRVTLVVRPSNELPQAYHDQYTTPQDTVLRVEAPGVLANDGHKLPVSLVRGPARGTVTLSADGSFVYTPQAGFNGVETFVYRISDPAASTYPFNQGGLSADDAQAWNQFRPRVEGIVTIRVGTIVNHPHAANDSYALRQGTELLIAAPGVLANDRGQANSSRLTAVLVRGPEHGTLTLNADGSFFYKPDANFVGIDVFAYRAEDAAANVLPHDSPIFNISVAKVSLYVTADSSVLALDDNYGVEQNKPLTMAAPGVLGNDIGSGKPLAATLLSRPEHGTLVFNSDGSFTYTPAADFYGVDRFTYRAREALPGAIAPSSLAASSIATVSLYVRPAKQPIIVNDDHYVTKQNTVLEVAARGVLGNDYLLDIQPPRPPSLIATGVWIPPPIFSATLLTAPTHGTVTLNADGSFRYVPDENFVGQDTFTYRGRWENGLDDPVYSGVGTVTISVAPADRIPLARDDYYYGLEGTPLEVGKPGVLANDERPAGTAFVPVIATPPSRGTMTLNADGSFRYVPADGFSGQDFFSYRLQQPGTAASVALGSNTAGVWLQIHPNNPVVHAEDDHYSTLAGSQLKVEAPGVLKNDRAFPILAPDTGGYLANFYPVPVRPITPTLTAKLLRGPSYGTLTLDADGSFMYTPRGDFAGVDTFQYKASAPSNVLLGGVFLIDDGFDRIDNGQPGDIQPHDVATVTINVIPQDQRTVVARDNEYRLRQDTTLTVAPPGVLGNDYLLTLEPATANSLAPHRLLHAALVAGPVHGTLTLRPDGGFTYIPAAGYVGLDQFTYRATDGTHSDEATVFLRVTSLRLPPRFVPGPNQVVTDDSSPRTIAGWTLPLLGDASPFTPSFQFEVLSDRPELFAVSPTIDPTGKLSFTPAPNTSGSANVTVILRDTAAPAGEGESAPQSFTITVAKPYRLHNTEQPLDVSGDGTVSPLDAVLVINFLNGSALNGQEQLAANLATTSDFLDANKDNFISAIDAVLVINYLNSLTSPANEPELPIGTIVYNMNFVEPEVSILPGGPAATSGQSSALDQALLLIADETARKRRL